ncbi:MAG: hypothetical protein SYC29_03520 [Planctomycetota bacterium]|nr:hypothetical protein [Planctomycetota bacterium]
MGIEDHKVHPGASAARARLILPFAAAGLFIACIVVLLQGSRESHTVSHVQRVVRDIALAGGSPDAPRGAGAIGPWKISASDVDPLTGEFADFHLEAGAIVLGAERAALFVDVKADTFGFELWDVVFSRVPPPGEDDSGAFVHRVDHYILGPAPYGKNIVPDANCGAPIGRPQPPAPSEQTVADGSAP